ncbi:MAG: hypothetical protein ACRC6M_07550 [Microcystaceae cyanobacterium]
MATSISSRVNIVLVVRDYYFSLADAQASCLGLFRDRPFPNLR